MGAPKTLRFQLMLSPDLMDRIDEFRFENRINGKAETCRLLIERALDTPNAMGAEEAGTSPRPGHGLSLTGENL